MTTYACRPLCFEPDRLIAFPLRRVGDTFRPTIRALIAGLFCASRPTAIPRLIVAIIVDPLKRVFGRGSSPHVGKKRDIGSAPPFAHDDAATAVIDESFVIGVQTSIPDSAPCRVFRCAMSFPGVAMNLVSIVASGMVEGVDRQWIAVRSPALVVHGAPSPCTVICERTIAFRKLTNHVSILPHWAAIFTQ